MFFYLFLGFLAVVGGTYADVSRGYWILTPTVREEFQNGSGGYCKSGEDGSSIVCDSGWINTGTVDGKLVLQDAGCRYFEKTTIYKCRYQASETSFPQEVCIRKVHFYQLRSECYGQWLGWSNCVLGDAYCSPGISWRFLFHTSANFRYQTRTCFNPNCPTWGKWVKPFGTCGSSCTKMWSRKCYLKGEEVSPSNCPIDFSGPIGNRTHSLFPCTESSCTNPSIPNPFPLEITKNGSPPPAAPPAPTLTPFLAPRQAEEADSTVFSMGTFWIGFCVGMAVAFAMLLFVCCVYLNTWKGKVTIAAIKTYRRNEKLYYDRKRRQEVDDPNQRKRATSHPPKIPMSYSRNSIGRESDPRSREPSMSSYPSWRKDEGYKSYPNSGSLSGHSKYQESLAQPAFGTYYTPNGESKLLNAEGRRSTHIVRSSMGSRNTSRYDSYESDSAEESLYDSPRTLNKKEGSHASLEVRTGGLFHEKHSGSRGHGGRFDEDAYMRGYKAYRAERMRETPGKYHSRRSRSPHKTPRKELDTNTRERSWKDPKSKRSTSARPSIHEVRYAKVMKKPASDDPQEEKREAHQKPHLPKVERRPTKLHQSYSEDIHVAHHEPINARSPTESVEEADFPPPPAIFYEESKEAPI